MGDEGACSICLTKIGLKKTGNEHSVEAPSPNHYHGENNKYYIF
jgi:hypothetical protein